MLQRLIAELPTYEEVEEMPDAVDEGDETADTGEDSRSKRHS